MSIHTHTKEKGFTLIELLVVIAIIGLLSSIILASVRASIAKAKDTTRKHDLAQLQVALEEYYQDHGSYPATQLLTVRTGYKEREWLDSYNRPTDWIPGLVPKYISQLPQEPDSNSLCLSDTPPSTGDHFGTSYRYKSDGVSYKIHDHCAPISAAMLNTSDPDYHCPDAHGKECSDTATNSTVCPGGTGHPNSWSVCGGPISCGDLWCGNSSGHNLNSDNLAE